MIFLGSCKSENQGMRRDAHCMILYQIPLVLERSSKYTCQLSKQIFLNLDKYVFYKNIYKYVYLSAI
jgi:hypothetical protein